MVHLADQPADSDAAELYTTHVMNSFDMVPGIVKESFGAVGLVDEVTVWDTIANLTGGRYAYRTVTNPQWYVVDLPATDFTTPARTQELNWTGSFTPVTV